MIRLCVRQLSQHPARLSRVLTPTSTSKEAVKNFIMTLRCTQSTASPLPLHLSHSSRCRRSAARSRAMAVGRALNRLPRPMTCAHLLCRMAQRGVTPRPHHFCAKDVGVLQPVIMNRTVMGASATTFQWTPRCPHCSPDRNHPIPADEITYKVRCAAPVLVPLSVHRGPLIDHR